MGDANEHAASASATGYLFQCRCALLMGLQAIPETPQLAISIERFDDVAFEVDGEPTQLIQTKHHLGKKGDLSDASVDLWKTLLICSNRVAKNVEAPFRLKFVLLTTARAPDSCAASYLRLRERNEAEADKRLLKTAARPRRFAPSIAWRSGLMWSWTRASFLRCYFRTYEISVSEFLH